MRDSRDQEEPEFLIPDLDTVEGLAENKIWPAVEKRESIEPDELIEDNWDQIFEE